VAAGDVERTICSVTGLRDSVDETLLGAYTAMGERELYDGQIICR
jgi:hypothetical protein